MSLQNTYAHWWVMLIEKWLGQAPEQQPSACLQAGRRAYEAGDYQACVDLIDRAFELETPPFTDNRFNKLTAFQYRSYAYQALGNHQRAAADMERVVGLKPSIARFYLELSRLHLNFQAFDKALFVLNEGLMRLDAKRAAELYLLRGKVAEKEGALQDAMDDYNLAVYHKPRYSEALCHRGRLLARTNNFNRAFADYREAIRAAPDDAAVYIHYGRILFSTGRFAEASRQLAEAVIRAPDKHEAAGLLGRCLVRLGNFTEALPILRKAKALGADDDETHNAFILAQQALGIEEDPGPAVGTANTASAPGYNQENLDSINYNKIYDRVEEAPFFPYFDEEEEDEYERRWAAEQALRVFVYQHLEYPEEALQTGVSGVVHLEFIIERDGRITGLRAKNRIGYGCEQAALNVIRKMIINDLHWEPGKINGIEVRTRYRLPVRFSISKAILDKLG